MKEHIGYAKLILFGEHFVVYGIPAIGMALKDLYTTCTLHPSDTWEIQGVNQSEVVIPALQSILAELKLIGPYKVVFNSNIPVSAGLGSGAAICVSFTRALSDHHFLKLTDKRINELAYEGEKFFHGSPSGIDNTLSTFGGVLEFTKGKPFTSLDIEPMPLIIACTGEKGSTKQMVANVKNLKEKNPEKFRKWMKEMEKIIESAKESLEQHDLETLGKLMDKNQELLYNIGVSTLELELLIEIAKDKGALGAKLTGAGGGGCIVALAKDGKDANTILQAIKQKGFQAFYSEQAL